MEVFDPQTVIRRYGLSPYRLFPQERCFDWVEEAMAWARTHYPDADPVARAVFAALVPGYTTGLFGGYGTDDHPLHQAADAFLMALAAWLPPAPGELLAWGPADSQPLSPEATARVLDLVEVFLFVSPEVAVTQALRDADALPAEEAEYRREALLRVRAYLEVRP